MAVNPKIHATKRMDEVMSNTTAGSVFAIRPAPTTIRTAMRLRNHVAKMMSATVGVFDMYFIASCVSCSQTLS